MLFSARSSSELTATIQESVEYFQPRYDDTQDWRNWDVSSGSEWMARIRIIGLVHVSQGTWQPILQIQNPYRFY
jgi:hypothetical protein